MSLSFGEKRAQTRALRNIAFWLNPQSRSFESSTSEDISIADLEKQCGPIRGTKFDADLFCDILKPTFDMAERFVIEYAATMGYKLTDMPISSEFPLVSTLPNGNPGKELDLTLAVLDEIIRRNRAISTRSEIIARLKKIIQIKAAVDRSKFPKIISSIEDRIANCDEVSEEEIQEFVDQIEKDENYHSHISTFHDREYLLKGVKHVQFLQKAHQVTNTINKSFYDALLLMITSVASRLSHEEMEEALNASSDHFKKVSAKRREYVADLKESVKSDTSGVFAGRVLLFGPKPACEDLAKLLKDNEAGSLEMCKKLLSNMPSSLYKLLFEGETLMLKTLFYQQGPFFASNFIRPMDCLIHSGILPLRKLLIPMNSPQCSAHLFKIFSSNNYVPIKESLLSLDASTAEWEETVQAVINSFFFVCVNGGLAPESVTHTLNIMREHSGDVSDTLAWLSKYQNYVRVAVWIGAMEDPEKSASKESVEAKKKEKKGKKKDEKEDRKEKKKKKEEKKREAAKEKKEDEDEKNEVKPEDEEEKEGTEKIEKKAEVVEGQKEVAAENVQNEEVPEASAGALDEKDKEAIKDLIEFYNDEKEDEEDEEVDVEEVRMEQVSQDDLTGANPVKEEEVKTDQVSHDLAGGDGPNREKKEVVQASIDLAVDGEGAPVGDATSEDEDTEDSDSDSESDDDEETSYSDEDVEGAGAEGAVPVAGDQGVVPVVRGGEETEEEDTEGDEEENDERLVADTQSSISSHGFGESVNENSECE